MPMRVVLFAVLSLFALGACSSKGKAGAACNKPVDCAHGYYCQGTCKAGPETACGYLARCIPLMDRDQVETLFGEGGREVVKSLETAPEEGACEGQLRILSMANRTVILNRACGPRVMKGP